MFQFILCDCFDFIEIRDEKMSFIINKWKQNFHKSENEKNVCFEFSCIPENTVLISNTNKIVLINLVKCIIKS